VGVNVTPLQGTKNKGEFVIGKGKLRYVGRGEVLKGEGAKKNKRSKTKKL